MKKYILEGNFTEFKRSSSIIYSKKVFMYHLNDLKLKFKNEHLQK